MIRSTRTSRPLKSDRAMRHAVAMRTAPRPAAPVPGRGGQIDRATDMRTSRVMNPPRNPGGMAAPRPVRPTGGRVDDADATNPGRYATNRAERRRIQRANRKAYRKG